MEEGSLFASYENLGMDYLVYRARIESYVVASHFTDGIDGSDFDYRSNVQAHLWARQTHWD